MEACISRAVGIKYVLKCICKESDWVAAVNIAGQGRLDELKLYQNSRYEPTSEEIWRILKFKTVSRKPVVVCVEAHLENDHTVY